MPTFVNGGHECLLIWAWDNCQGLLTEPEWDASVNRHLGQRNVHVVDLAGGAGVGPPLEPVTIAVGPLFGGPATLALQREHPANMPWLQLRTGRGIFPPRPCRPGTSGSRSRAARLRRPTRSSGTATRSPCTRATTPRRRAAPTYRVTASQAGAAFGGYTVVALG